MPQARKLCLEKKEVTGLRSYTKSVAETGQKLRFLDSQPRALSSTDHGFPAYGRKEINGISAKCYSWGLKMGADALEIEETK